MRNLIAMYALLLSLSSCQRIPDATTTEEKIAYGEHLFNEENFQEAINTLEDVNSGDLRAYGKPFLLIYSYLGASGFTGTQIFPIVKAIQKFDENQEFMPQLQLILREVPHLNETQQAHLKKSIDLLDEELNQNHPLTEDQHFYIGNIYAFKVLTEIKDMFETFKDVSLDEPIRWANLVLSEDLFDRSKNLYTYTDRVKNHYGESYPKLQAIVEGINNWVDELVNRFDVRRLVNEGSGELANEFSDLQTRARESIRTTREELEDRLNERLDRLNPFD